MRPDQGEIPLTKNKFIKSQKASVSLTAQMYLYSTVLTMIPQSCDLMERLTLLFLNGDGQLWTIHW